MKPIPNKSSQSLQNTQMQGKTTHQSRILHLPQQHKNTVHAGTLSTTMNTANDDQESRGTRTKLPRLLDHTIQDLRQNGSAEGVDPKYAVVKVYVKKSRRKIYKT